MQKVEITEQTSLRDIIGAYPETRGVMAQYGMMECGGSAGPDEPLGWFARVHKVDPGSNGGVAAGHRRRDIAHTRRA